MKKWYAIKHKTAKRWTAYHVTAAQVKDLKDGYECRGPFKSLAAAMLTVHEGKQKRAARPRKE